MFGGSGDAQLDVQGHITASGNISASGLSHTFGGDVAILDDLTVGDNLQFTSTDAIISDNSDNERIQFTMS